MLDYVTIYNYLRCPAIVSQEESDGRSRVRIREEVITYLIRFHCMRVEGGSNSGACHPEAFRRDAQKLAGGVPCGQRNLIRYR